MFWRQWVEMQSEKNMNVGLVLFCFSNFHSFGWLYVLLFATGNSDSANKVAEKLEELSVKDGASEGKKEEDKKETKKEDEEKVKAEEKNWEPRTCFADLQFISFSSFSTIDSKWTEFGHLHIISFFYYLFCLKITSPWCHWGEKIEDSGFMKKKKSFPPTPLPLHHGMPHFASLSSTVQCYFWQTVKRGLW